MKRGRKLDTSRDADMVKRFKSGETLISIGDSYGISRERVRQILKRYDITGKDGGRTIQGIETRERLRKEKELKYHKHMDFWGCSKAVRDQFSDEIQQRYKQQRNNANNKRGIEWTLTLPEWWEIWESSGKWTKRGLHHGGYVMSRLDFNKGFTYDNCYITLLEESSHFGICHAMGW